MLIVIDMIDMRDVTEQLEEWWTLEQKAQPSVPWLVIALNG